VRQRHPAKIDVAITSPGNSSEHQVLLETRGLTKDFGGVRAVAGVDFLLRRGELRCLIGPNGAGKSTFFKMLTGQLQPTSGTILFEGINITGEPQHQIARLGIGIKNQVASVWDGLTVLEHLWIAARRKIGSQAATPLTNRLLTELKLAPIAGRVVGALSHGERQWVEIGMVIAQQPKIMLLDEPTAGMGADEVQRTVGLLRAVGAHTSIIVVEHDMQFIEKIASTVTVFHQGRILVEDTMVNVLANALVRDIYLGGAHATG
jgi:branched-chain amino acid transport system ATP-binding protein/urea transport system ATP-binding protein